MKKLFQNLLLDICIIEFNINILMAKNNIKKLYPSSNSIIYLLYYLNEYRKF